MTKARILVVDDEQQNLDILRIFLRALNYEVKEVMTGKDALQIVEQESFDLILLDVMLPDLSGFEIYQRLKKRGDFNFQVIFMSADAQKESIRKGLELGALEYLTKPFNLDMLEENLNTALNIKD